MWTWMIVSLALSAVTAQEDPPQPITCSSIRPLRNLNVSELRGDWVILETLAFSEGHPSELGEESLLHSPLCLRAAVHNVSRDELSVRVDIRFPGEEDHADTSRYLAQHERRGRWSVKSHLPEGSEMLVIAADTSEYMVWVLCPVEPPAPGSEPLADKLPASVTVYSRRLEGSGPGVLTRQKLGQVRRRLVQIMGLHKYTPVHLNTDC